MNSPFTIAGVIIGGLGWVFLLVGVGVDTGGMIGQVANLHKVAIAQAAILTGGILMVCGIVSDGFEQLKGKSKAGAVVHTSKVQQPHNSNSEAGSSVPGGLKLSMREREELKRKSRTI